MRRPIRIVALHALAALSLLAACGGDGPSQPDPVGALQLSVDTAYVYTGNTARPQASAVSQGGRPLPNAALSWSSSDAAVASVAADGTITGRAPGTATITARAGTVSAEVVVHVTRTSGIRILSGGGVADTLTAVLPQPLVLEVRDAEGRPMAGARLDLESVYLSPSYNPSVTFFTSQPDEYTFTAGLTTDSLGRASVRLRLGVSSGAGGVVLRRTAGPFMDTVPFTVRPGAPARVRLAPRDTAMFAGRTLALRTALMDRGGNPTTGPVSYAVLDGPTAVQPGGQVSTSGHGVSRVVARTSIGADTVRVAVVPEGALALSSRNGGVGVVNLDGSGRRVIAFNGGEASWSATGDHVVFGQDGLFTVGLSGDPVRRVTTPGGTSAHWPQYSRDGAWLYFHSVKPDTALLWRVRASDYGGMERVTPPGARLESHASPSPDGTRVTYFAGHIFNAQIRVRDLATGVESGDLARGWTPTWSPAGDLIAFVQPQAGGLIGQSLGSIAVIRPDGTGLRTLTAPGVLYQFSPRWSPDGRWIVAAEYQKIHLIEAATGLVIELPEFFESIASVAWKPGALLP
jgi:hypothetical protein